MRFLIISLHADLQFIISTDSELMACVTELGHGVVLHSRQTEPWGLPTSVCQVTSGSKGLGRLWGAAVGGMRDEREFIGQMGKVMHKKLKQTGKQNKQKPNPKKANTPHPRFFVIPISWEYKRII